MAKSFFADGMLAASNANPTQGFGLISVSGEDVG